MTALEYRKTPSISAFRPQDLVALWKF